MLSLGGYRNKYTDAIEFQIRSTANTNIVFFNGKLLACKEDGPPFAMDPNTLETIGVCDFDGQLESATFTAHPKFDPKTGEMVCFGYEAKGDGTPDINYYTFDSNGKMRENVWLTSPVVAMIHDFAVTEKYVSSRRASCLDHTGEPTAYKLLGHLPDDTSDLLSREDESRRGTLAMGSHSSLLHWRAPPTWCQRR